MKTHSAEELEFFSEYLPKLGFPPDGIELLGEMDLKKAHDAFRQHKKRTSDAKKGKSKKTVNLTQEAHDILSNLAKKDNVTLSQWIEKHLNGTSLLSVTLSHKTTIVPSPTIKKAKGFIGRKSSEFDISISWNADSRISASQRVPHLRHDTKGVKREIFDVVMNCRQQIEDGKDEMLSIGETYQTLTGNSYFLGRTIEDQCSIIAAVLEHKQGSDRKAPDRIDPNDIAKAIRTWLEIQEESSAISA